MNNLPQNKTRENPYHQDDDFFAHQRFYRKCQTS